MHPKYLSAETGLTRKEFNSANKNVPIQPALHLLTIYEMGVALSLSFLSKHDLFIQNLPIC